jgi:hypothetical protein
MRADLLGNLRDILGSRLRAALCEQLVHQIQVGLHKFLGCGRVRSTSPVGVTRPASHKYPAHMA